MNKVCTCEDDLATFDIFQIPGQCFENNRAALNIIHFLTDSEFLGRDNPDSEYLAYATIFLRGIYPRYVVGHL